MAKTNSNLTDRIWRWLGSVRITVPLLILLAVAAVIGTVVPQGASPEELARMAGPRAAGWLVDLGIADLYHSPPFELLLLLLAANIVVCTLERLPLIWRSAARDPGRFEEGWAKLLPFYRTFSLPPSLGIEQARVRARAALKGEGWIREAPAAEGWAYRVRRGGFARLAPYTVHLGILSILAGALYGGVLGFRGEIRIPEGSSTDLAHRLRTGEEVRLPFEVRCDRFTVEYYEGTDNPSRYASDLKIVEGGAVRLAREIEVNHPLRWGGYTLYQSSYGALDPEWFDLEVRLPRGGAKVERLRPGEPRPLDGTGRSIAVVDFTPDYAGTGPAALIEESAAGSPPKRFPVFLRMPSLHGAGGGDLRVRLKGFDRRSYTGLMVTKDPGTTVVWLGSILLVAGLLFGFFWPRREIWAGVVRSERGPWMLALAARPLGEGEVGDRAERIAARLRAALGEG